MRDKSRRARFLWSCPCPVVGEWSGSVCDTSAVPGGPVRFTLDDGETLTVAEENVQRVYDLLWQLAPQPGAITTAAVLHAAAQQSEFSRLALELTATQSTMLRQAVALLDDDPR